MNIGEFVAFILGAAIRHGRTMRLIMAMLIMNRPNMVKLPGTGTMSRKGMRREMR